MCYKNRWTVQNGTYESSLLATNDDIDRCEPENSNDDPN